MNEIEKLTGLRDALAQIHEALTAVAAACDAVMRSAHRTRAHKVHAGLVHYAAQGALGQVTRFLATVEKDLTRVQAGA